MCESRGDKTRRRYPNLVELFLYVYLKSVVYFGAIYPDTSFERKESEKHNHHSTQHHCISFPTLSVSVLFFFSALVLYLSHVFPTAHDILEMPG